MSHVGMRVATRPAGREIWADLGVAPHRLLKLQPYDRVDESPVHAADSPGSVMSNLLPVRPVLEQKDSDRMSKQVTIDVANLVAETPGCPRSLQMGGARK